MIFYEKEKWKKDCLENRIRGSILKRSIEDYTKETGKHCDIEKSVLVSWRTPYKSCTMLQYWVSKMENSKRKRMDKIFGGEKSRQ